MSTLRRRLGGQEGNEKGKTPAFNHLVGLLQAELLADYPDLIPSGSSGGDGRQLHQAVKSILTAKGWARKGPAMETLVDRLVDEVSGYGPITPLLADRSVNEVMVNGPGAIYVERGGRLELTDLSFRDDEHLMSVISRMVAPLGRRVDRTSPHVDGRLPDGSRIHAILPPLSLVGPVLTVRKFRSRGFSLADLVRNGTLSAGASEFLELSVRGRLNAIIAGGAGAGKTTTLNALLNLVESGSERIITMEDAAELRLDHDHVISLETRPPNLEGRGEVSMRHLLRNALRMRPDRLIMGEVRGEEAFDLLQAMNTGHEGCLSTVHASGAYDALRRLENMVLMSGHRLDLEAASRQLRMALDLIVFQMRTPGGRRIISDISLVNSRGEPHLHPVFKGCLSRGQHTLVSAARGLPVWLKDHFWLYGVEVPETLLGDLGGWAACPCSEARETGP